MPILKINTAYKYKKEAIHNISPLIAQAISELYDCKLEQIWVNFDYRSDSDWFYKGQMYRSGELELILYEFSCFQKNSLTSIDKILLKISQLLKTQFDQATVFGHYRGLEANEVVFNEKLLTQGA